MNEVRDSASNERRIEEVCDAVRDLVAPQVALLKDYSWVGSANKQTFEFVKRAAVIRQFEAANAILALVKAGHGSFGVTLLRPAYEELVWIEYLKKNDDFSLSLVQLLTKKELLDSHQYQKQYLGQSEIRKLGFTKKLSRRIEHGVGDPDEELKSIGASLGWRRGKSQPPVAFVARKVGREKQYNYLYQGTSRSVHFSPHELQRRVWGVHGKVNIASNHFEKYWSDFAMSWSFRILIETLVGADLVSDLPSQGNNEELVDLMEELRPVQILTASELEAWDEPRPALQ